MAALSQRAYAKHRHVSVSAVQRAIAARRITPLPDGKNDPVVADQEWEANTLYARGDSSDEAVQQFLRARAVREHYQARLARLEFEARSGRLVSSAAVQAAPFNTFRRFRDAMTLIPDRLASVLAAESDEHKVHNLLSAEIRQALNVFADAQLRLKVRRCDVENSEGATASRQPGYR